MGFRVFVVVAAAAILPIAYDSRREISAQLAQAGRLQGRSVIGALPRPVLGRTTKGMHIHKHVLKTT